MKLPRPTRTTLIFSLCLIALASVLAYENHQLSLVSNDLASTADKDSLNALLTRLAKVDERLDAVDSKHLVTNDDFRSGQQALSNRIDTVQAYAKQATETTHDLSLRVTAAEEQVMVLKASIEMIDIRLQELCNPQASEPPMVAPPPKPVIRKKPPPAPLNWSSNPGHRLRCLCRFLLHGYWRQVVVVAVEPDSVVSHEEASYILPGFFNCHVALLGHPL